MVTFALSTLEFVVLWVVFFATDSSVVEHVILYTLLTLMGAWAHPKAMLTNPGKVPREAIPLDGEDDAESSRRTLYGRFECFQPTGRTQDLNPVLSPCPTDGSEDLRSGTAQERCEVHIAMTSTEKTPFFGEDPTADPDDRHSRERFRCCTSEGQRIWCKKTDVSGVIMVTFALSTLEFVVLWAVFFATDSSVVEHVILYTLLTLMGAWAHPKAMLTDPGTGPRGAIPLDGEDDAESNRRTLYGRLECFQPTRPLKVRDEADPFSTDLGVTERGDIVRVLEEPRASQVGDDSLLTDSVAADGRGKPVVVRSGSGFGVEGSSALDDDQGGEQSVEKPEKTTADAVSTKPWQRRRRAGVRAKPKSKSVTAGGGGEGNVAGPDGAEKPEEPWIRRKRAVVSRGEGAEAWALAPEILGSDSFSEPIEATTAGSAKQAVPRPSSQVIRSAEESLPERITKLGVRGPRPEGNRDSGRRVGALGHAHTLRSYGSFTSGIDGGNADPSRAPAMSSRGGGGVDGFRSPSSATKILLIQEAMSNLCDQMASLRVSAEKNRENRKQMMFRRLSRGRPLGIRRLNARDSADTAVREAGEAAAAEATSLGASPARAACVGRGKRREDEAGSGGLIFHPPWGK